MRHEQWQPDLCFRPCLNDNVRDYPEESDIQFPNTCSPRLDLNGQLYQGKTDRERKLYFLYLQILKIYLLQDLQEKSMISHYSVVDLPYSLLHSCNGTTTST